MNKRTYYNFSNQGYMVDTVPDELYEGLKELCKKAFNYNEKANDILAGKIDKEFYLNEGVELIKNYIYNLCEDYSKQTNFFYVQRIRECLVKRFNNYYYDLNSLWVNFQARSEYNPVHRHSGLYSFVIWMQVPYTYEEENLHNKTTASNGSFFFHVNNPSGDLDNNVLKVDKTWEKKIAIFPSDTNHSVTPFYSSDKFRISVAGNVFLGIND
jgi:hypothetical protein